MLQKALEQALAPDFPREKNELIQGALEKTRKQRVLTYEILKNVKEPE